MWKVEGLFGEAKNFTGLRRARYRGRSNMQMQAYMVATVQNLKRLATITIIWFKEKVFALKLFKVQLNLPPKNLIIGQTAA